MAFSVLCRTPTVLFGQGLLDKGWDWQNLSVAPSDPLSLEISMKVRLTPLSFLWITTRIYGLGQLQTVFIGYTGKRSIILERPMGCPATQCMEFMKTEKESSGSRHLAVLTASRINL